MRSKIREGDFPCKSKQKCSIGNFNTVDALVRQISITLKCIHCDQAECWSQFAGQDVQKPQYKTIDNPLRACKVANVLCKK